MKTITCQECGIAVERDRLTRGQRFCSPRCGLLARARREGKTPVTLTCAGCQRPFVMPRSMAIQKFCSRACWIVGIRKYPKVRRCERCGVDYTATNTRTQRFCSKTCAHNKGGSVSSQGYRVIHINQRPVLEHRHIMEKILGRPLLPTESVHHLDGNRANNDPANLELWDKSHVPGQRVADKITWCLEFLKLHGFRF